MWAHTNAVTCSVKYDSCKRWRKLGYCSAFSSALHCFAFVCFPCLISSRLQAARDSVRGQQLWSLPGSVAWTHTYCQCLAKTCWQFSTNSLDVSLCVILKSQFYYRAILNVKAFLSTIRILLSFLCYQVHLYLKICAHFVTWFSSWFMSWSVPRAFLFLLVYLLSGCRPYHQVVLFPCLLIPAYSWQIIWSNICHLTFQTVPPLTTAVIFQFWHSRHNPVSATSLLLSLNLSGVSPKSVTRESNKQDGGQH